MPPEQSEPHEPDSVPPPPSGHQLKAIVFDVNETLSDMTPLQERFEEVGAPAGLMRTWFAGVLRDGFALAAAGAYADFADIARDGLRALLAELDARGPDEADEAARHILDGMDRLPVHPDVPAGVHALRRAGFRLVTMTNGSPEMTDGLLKRAGVRDQFDALLSVSGPRCWKPAPDAYRYAVRRAGVRPGEALLVAVHPWDVDGAQRAGLAGAWLRRGAVHYPETMSRPKWAAEDLEELAASLAERAGGQGQS
ncbi:haloacid dehalogenase type II [Streptomyces sp. WMMB 322]|uniref:haloacid dehalogenase type II n=1 Tax=Streptomyces sp. WMMB 322 TaxID=1286821 RepID=UPI000823DA20|nr:haloacid dehalogenase type II [Streptomyces sp. WMMB 322]SCK45395.1 2-haloacid dehalogenase [Streptomyces sp. WMMB 322]